MTHPLITTVGNAVDATLRGHGREDFRRGAPFNHLAAEAWRQWWVDEARLMRSAVDLISLDHAMALTDLERVVWAAQRVLSQCTVSKPTRLQAEIMREAKPLLHDAEARLARIRANFDAATKRDGE